MKISAAIITYNDADVISDCIKSLLSQSRKPDEIVLLDDGSTDNTVAIAKKFPIKVHTSKRIGMAYARDKVWRLCKCDIIVFAESDSVFSKTWLSEIEKAFKQGAEPFAVAKASGKSRHKGAEPFAVAKASGKSRHKGADAVLDKRLVYQPKGYFQESQQAFFELRYSNYSPETAWAYRKKILEEIKGVDSQLIWPDDKLLAKKLLKAGYKITFAPKAIQFHKGEPKTVIELIKKQFNKAYQKSKHYFHAYPEDIKPENFLFTFFWFVFLFSQFNVFVIFNLTAFLALIFKMFFIDKSYKVISSKYLPCIAVIRIVSVISMSLGTLWQMLDSI